MQSLREASPLMVKSPMASFSWISASTSTSSLTPPSLVRRHRSVCSPRHSLQSGADVAFAHRPPLQNALPVSRDCAAIATPQDWHRQLVTRPTSRCAGLEHERLSIGLLYQDRPAALLLAAYAVLGGL